MSTGYIKNTPSGYLIMVNNQWFGYFRSQGDAMASQSAVKGDHHANPRN